MNPNQASSSEMWQQQQQQLHNQQAQQAHQLQHINDAASTSSMDESMRHYPPPPRPTHYQPQLQGQQGVNMWMNAGYPLPDSGIHSGGTGATPSVMSGATSLHNELVNQSFGNETMNATNLDLSFPGSMHGTPQRQSWSNTPGGSRMGGSEHGYDMSSAMFPEQMESCAGEAAYEQHPAMAPSHHAAQQLPPHQQLHRHRGHPSPMPDNRVAYMVGGSDAQANQAAMPQLVELLSDPDPVVAENTAIMIADMARKQSSAVAVYQCVPLVKKLCAILDAAIDALQGGRAPMITPDTVVQSASVLFRLSQYGGGQTTLMECAAIPLIVKFLTVVAHQFPPQYQQPFVLYYMVVTAHNLLMHHPPAKEVAFRSGLIERLSDQLASSDNEKFIAIVVGSLLIIAKLGASAKKRMHDSGCTLRCLHIMEKYQYEKLLYTTTKMLKTLSMCEKNKHLLVQNGLQILARHLTHASPRLNLSCLTVLRNLSNAANNVPFADVELVMQQTLAQLGSSNRSVVGTAGDILANLTANQQANKQYLVQHNAVSYLVRVLQSEIRNEEKRAETCEGVLATLRHLIARHPDEVIARSEFMKIPGSMVVVVQFLETMLPPLVKAALGVLKLMCKDMPEARAMLLAINDNPNDPSSIPRPIMLAHSVIRNAVDGLRAARNENRPLESVVYDDVPALHLVTAAEQYLVQQGVDVPDLGQLEFRAPTATPIPAARMPAQSGIPAQQGAPAQQVIPAQQAPPSLQEGVEEMQM